MSLLLRSLLASLTTLAAADAPSLTGKWQVNANAAGRESQAGCTFTQKSNGLTGNCRVPRGDVNITGTVEGKKVTWTYKSDSEGGPVTVVYKGTLDAANKITGTVTAVEFGIEGDFTATQSQSN